MSLFDRFRLDGRRALITGGSRGLGRVMAQALAEAGADLVLVGRDAESLASAQSELTASTGRQVETITADVGLPSEAQRVCDLVLGGNQPIDILVNNVGGRRISIPTESLPLADWQTIIDLNLTSAFVLCSRVGGAMLPRGRGSVINVASISGIIVNKGIHGRAYETAKAALTAFTKTLAVDWAPSGVRANVIAPGGFLTEPNRRWFQEKPELQETFESMIPMGHLGDPNDLGPLAVYLASDASRYMTGSVLVIDGGYTLW
jgi:gluconate 5-dehydrogenase